MRVGIISDTHCLFDEKVKAFLEQCDTIWHAGDIGNIETADKVAAFKPMMAVHGNIDDHIVRASYPKHSFFEVDGLRVLITHIGGYPGKYDGSAFALIASYKPNIFVCGHSHILKVIFDSKLDMLVINPGAAGANGFHHVRTAIRMTIDGGKPSDLEVGEWPR